MGSGREGGRAVGRVCRYSGMRVCTRESRAKQGGCEVDQGVDKDGSRGAKKEPKCICS